MEPASTAVASPDLGDPSAKPASGAIQLLGRILMQVVLAAALTAYSIHFSMLHHRLMWRPIGDDAFYFNDALWRLRTLHNGGLIAWLREFWNQPPHAPFSTLLAMGSFSVFGWHDWAPYAGNGLIVLGLLLAADWLIGPATWWQRLLVYGLVLSTRLPKMCIEEFRPDFASALASAIGVMFTLRKPMLRSRVIHPLVAGVWFGLAIFFKPTTFALSSIAFALSMALRMFMDYRRTIPSPGTPGEGEGGGFSSQSHERPPPQPSPGVPEEGERGGIVKSFALALLGAAIVAGPFFIAGGREIFSYFYTNAFGDLQQVWAVHLSLLDSLRYYIDGQAGRFAIGQGQMYLLLAVAAAGVIIALIRGQWDKLKFAAALAGVMLVAYAVPTAAVVKNVFFGGLWQILLLMAAIRALHLLLTETRGKWGQAAFILACVLSICMFEKPMAREAYAGASDPRVIASNRLTADIYQAIKQRSSTAYVFIPAEGQSVEPACLTYLAGLDGNALNFHPLDFARWNDEALIQQQLDAADFVIVGDPGNDEVRTNLPTIAGVAKYLADVQGRPDFQEIGFYPTANGKRYYLYEKNRLKG
ncbi:MAG: hypothetical protein ABSG31_16990 [Tepidisphaeraceae bacterium]|jgi:hypothetical protein